MSEPPSICVIRFLGASSGFSLPSAVSPKWNASNRAYEALAIAFGFEAKHACSEHWIHNEHPIDLANELREEISNHLLIESGCPLRVIDITKCRLGINILDAVIENFRELALAASHAAVLLLPAYFIPIVMGSPRFLKLDNILRAQDRVLFLVDQVGNTERIGERDGVELPNPIPKLQEFGAPPTADEFRRRAVRQSNRWFGHFIMSSGAHVRTHYDCYPGVLLDSWLFRFVEPAAAKLVEELKPDVMVGFGLADLSVMHFANQMQRNGSPSCVIKGPESNEYLAKIPRGSRVLLVSDIVLTGKSAEELKREIENAGATVVGLLTLLALANSVLQIGGDVPVSAICTVNRSFYESPEECPLCRCEYPEQRVRRRGDFHILSETIHPYDFWEAVHETGAFSSEHKEIHGKHYSYYIDIEKLCTMYAEPIARQLVHQFQLLLHFPPPKFVLYPESAAAKMLAEIVGRHLLVKRENVLPLDREYLASLPSIVNFRLDPSLAGIRKEPVVVVDDGCNTLETISSSLLK